MVSRATALNRKTSLHNQSKSVGETRLTQVDIYHRNLTGHVDIPLGFNREFCM